MLNLNSCIKEYSYERAPLDSLTDTIPAPAQLKPIYTQCSKCVKNPDYELGKWSFQIDTFTFCGNISNAVMLSERSAFTFFGPSACSSDSGLIITCYLDNPFSTEAKNVVVDRTTLRYYNHLGAKDMLQAEEYLGFFLKIESYSDSSKIMKGNFGGRVSTDKDDYAQITNGKFEIKF